MKDWRFLSALRLGNFIVTPLADDCPVHDARRTGQRADSAHPLYGLVYQFYLPR